MYCTNLYKLLEVSCLGVGTCFFLIKCHVQKRMLNIIYLMIFLQEKCLIINISLTTSYHFYLVFEFCWKISKFPTPCFSLKKALLYLLVCWFPFYFTKVTTFESYLFLQSICFFCLLFLRRNETYFVHQVEQIQQASDLSYFMNYSSCFIFCC